MITIPGCTTRVAGHEVDRRPSDPRSWLDGKWITIRLYRALEALRVHVNAGSGAVTKANLHLVAGAGPGGRWYAIGDFIMPRQAYIASRALPKTPTRLGDHSVFTHQSLATFAAGTVLNVGIAGPLFGHRGGGAQAEFLEGIPAKIRPLEGFWSSSSGRA